MSIPPSFTETSRPYELEKRFARAPSVTNSTSSNEQQTELRQTLKERHVNMIGFSTVLGVGLFLSSGKAIHIAGPGMAVIAYLLMATLMWSVMASMGEMTALFPVKGPVFEFARRFIDEAVGYATAWMLWFGYVCVLVAEILAITQIFRFEISPDYLKENRYPADTVSWPAGVHTNSGVWVFLALLGALLLNLLPVRQYGRIEYIFGSVKIAFLVALIMIMTILNSMQRFHPTRFWTYEEPYGFASRNITLRQDVESYDDLVVDGSSGRFLAFWTCMVTSFFSLMGFDVILITAPENRDLQQEETIKISSRKITLRVVVLYALAVFTVGLNVPYTDPLLVNYSLNGVGGGRSSAFVLAAVREQVPFLPHFLNAFFVFSAFVTGANSLYSASRILHAISSLPDAWPRWSWVESIRSRLERTRLGVPVNAVILSWLVGFLAFLSTSGNTADHLGRLVDTSSESILIVYGINCFAFLMFFKQINAAAAGEKDEELNLTPAMRSRYKRTARQYPYRSHLQWIRALYGTIFCLLLILFQGWRTFIPPMVGGDFVASYISIPAFVILSAAYFFKTRGFNPANWHRRAPGLVGLETVGPIVVQDHNQREPCSFCHMTHRRGRLVLTKEKGAAANVQKTKAVLEWLWTWLK